MTKRISNKKASSEHEKRLLKLAKTIYDYEMKCSFDKSNETQYLQNHKGFKRDPCSETLLQTLKTTHKKSFVNLEPLPSV